jgi:hypothetical protein
VLVAAIALMSNLPPSHGASNEPAVEITDRILSTDSTAFTVILKPIGMRDAYLRDQKRIQVAFSTASSLVTYSVPSMNVRPLKIDLGDANELKKLRPVLEAYRAFVVASSTATETRKYVDAEDDFKKVAGAYDGLLGEAVLGFQYDNSIPDHTRIVFGPKNPDERNGLTEQIVYEPMALLYVIDHLVEIRDMHKDAIATKEKRQLAVQQAAEARRGAERGAIEAAAKEKERLHQVELREIKHKEELEALRAQEAERELARQKELEEGKRQRVHEYLAKPEGQTLAVKIQQKQIEVENLDRKEREYLTQMRKEQEGYLMAFADLTASSFQKGLADEGLRQATIRLGVAESRHRPSARLAQMMADVRGLMAQFEKECGLAYKEAMILGGLALIEQAAPASGSLTTLMYLIVIFSSIFVYFDARRIGVKKIADVKGVTNMGPVGWAICSLLLWILVFPLYLIKRPGFKKRFQAGA